MKYLDLAQIFSAHEANHPRYHLDGLITFSDFGPFENPSYTQLDRTYAVSSNNKAFLPNRLGFSIFGTCMNWQRSPCQTGTLYASAEWLGPRRVLPDLLSVAMCQ